MLFYEKVDTLAHLHLYLLFQIETNVFKRFQFHCQNFLRTHSLAEPS